MTHEIIDKFRHFEIEYGKRTSDILSSPRVTCDSKAVDITVCTRSVNCTATPTTSNNSRVSTSSLSRVHFVEEFRKSLQLRKPPSNS